MPRSFIAGVLNRYETSNQKLDELLSIGFAQNQKKFQGARRHRARLLAQEVVRRKATLDQILKVYSSRAPENMEHHVRTVLRMALAEWFFVEPLPKELRPGGKRTDDRGDDRDRDDRDERDRDDRDDDRGRGRGRSRRGDESDDDYDSDDEREQRRNKARERARLTESGDDHDRDDRYRDDRDDDRDDRDRGRGRRRRRRRRGRRHEWADERSQEDLPVPRGPIAAAIVNLVGSGRPSRGFVNGVLRAIDRETRWDPDGTIGLDERPRNVIPAAGGGTYTFERPLFADPERKPVTWLSQFCSMPKWLADRFVTRYGMEDAIAIGEASNVPPALSLRVNTRKIKPADLFKQMTAEGIGVHKTELDEVFRIEPTLPLVGTKWFEEGLFYLQDFTAARTARMPKLKPGMAVLDACAAPGGKITHACEIMGGKGKFVACDSSDRRLLLLEDNLERLGHDEIDVVCADLRDYANKSDEKFDVIFVDAPCSNTGVLSRRADARWRVSDAMQKSLIKLQVELLQAARKMLNKGGQLVYSTCTLEPEENRGAVVKAGGLEVVEDYLWLPEAGLHDGGYQSVLKAAE